MLNTLKINKNSLKLENIFMIEVVAAIPKLEVEEELPIMGPLKSPFHQWENSFT